MCYCVQLSAKTLMPLADAVNSGELSNATTGSGHGQVWG